jgi:hypothetical protein
MQHLQAGFDDPAVYSLGKDISDDKEDAAVLSTILPFLRRSRRPHRRGRAHPALAAL